MSSRFSNRFTAPVAAAVVASGLLASPAHAGFFDELFGGAAPSAPSTPSYNYDQQLPQAAPETAPRPKKKRVVVDEKPVLQQPTDIWHDKTLHVGDAVMMKDGIRIYGGGGGTKHTLRQFQPLDASRAVGSGDRKRLAAADTTRNDPLRGTYHPDTVASGRSAAVGAPVSAGIKITDARGQSIRYVGP